MTVGTPAAWELAAIDGVGQAELVRSGAVSARELAEAALARIEEVDPQLGSVMWRMSDLERQLEALEGRDRGPLHGVPTLLKDIGERYAGAPRWDGSRFYGGGIIDDHDSELVARMRRAGLVFVGKSTSSEFGNANETTFPGPTHNPWDPSRSTGGSSAGAAAAVAAGLVPVAHASDSGGSIRWPAAWCGLVGLKPNRARNPLGPDGTEGTAGLRVAHVVTRSVRDCAAALDALAGPEVGGPYLAPPRAASYAVEAQRDPGRLRIAFCTEIAGAQPVDERCREAVLTTAALCEELGHVVSEDAPRFDVEGLLRDFEGITFDGNAAAIEGAEATVGRAATAADIEPMTWWLAARGRERTAAEHLGSVGRLHRRARDLVAFVERYDLWLTPTNPTPPAPHAELTPTAATVEDVWWRRELGGGVFTLLANATGQPAISLPLHWTAEGLPVGSHFTSHHGREDVLLALAGQLERSRPWAHRWPALVPGRQS